MIDLNALKWWALGLLLAIAAFVGFRNFERKQGAIEAKLHIADSTVKVLTKAVAQDSLDALRLAQEAQRAAQALSASKQATNVLVGQSEAKLTAYRSEHEAADALIRDSLATVPALKTELGKVLASSDSMAGAFGRERQAWIVERGKSDSAYTSLTRFSQSQTQEIHDLRTIRDQLTNEVSLLKRSQPSGVGIWVGRGIALGVGILAGRASK